MAWTHELSGAEVNCGDFIPGAFWLGFAYDDNLPPFVGNIVGYPGDNQPPNLMWRSTCDIDPVDGYPDLFETQCDTYPGSSGSSIYDYDGMTKTRTVFTESTWPRTNSTISA